MSRSRDRHGRGLRGPLAWPHVPAMVSRRVAFDGLVLDAADRWSEALRQRRIEVEFAVEDVPPSDPAPWEEQLAPLARLFPPTGGLPHRIVIYRRPVESRSADRTELAVVVNELVLEQVALVLGVPPSELDGRAEPS